MGRRGLAGDDQGPSCNRHCTMLSAIRKHAERGCEAFAACELTELLMLDRRPLWVFTSQVRPVAEDHACVWALTL